MIRNISLMLALAIAPNVCLAQGGNSSDLFGMGVHQYFRGQHNEAIDSFNLAIAASPKDPRSYFFRGLCKDCAWGMNAGDDDFRQGAYLESFKNGQPSSIVNRSLERIQGCRRLVIEKFRREARQSYHFIKNLPPPKAKQIMYGEMIDVNSLSPIIQNVVPIQSNPQPSVELPGEEIIDFDPTLDSEKVIPTDATPMPEEDDAPVELEPETPGDPFSTTQNNADDDNQTETASAEVDDDPFDN